MRLRYGCNPHQHHAVLEPPEGLASPLRVRNGSPSYVNVLDALGAWQLVAEARDLLGLPAAASFKHVSPAGAAVAVELPDDLAQAYEVRGRTLSPLAIAYVRARGADPKSSFGDFAALSDPVDAATAAVLSGVVSDGVIAPGYEPGALERLSAKRDGRYLVLEIDPAYRPPARERREVFGLRLEQDRNERRISGDELERAAGGALPPDVRRDLLLGLVALKYTQSNAVAYVLDGQLIGSAAGQQSRVDCTRLAGAKADTWHLRRHPRILGLRFRKEVKRQERINWRVRCIEGLSPSEEKELAGSLAAPFAPLEEDERRDWIGRLRDVSMVSDAFLPFRDNVDHAARHGVGYIAHQAGSRRDAEIEAACAEHGIRHIPLGVRLFCH